MSSLEMASDRNKHRVLSALGDPAQAKGVAHSIDSYIDVTVTAAQLDTLNATPVELVPAPGSNKVLMFLGAFIYLDYVSATYAGSSESLAIKYENASGASVGTATEAFVESTADAYYVVAPINAVALANKALVLTATADLTTGDGIMYFRVYYRTITADLSAE
jgi:hypothetical protein